MEGDRGLLLFRVPSQTDADTAAGYSADSAAPQSRADSLSSPVQAGPADCESVVHSADPRSAACSRQCATLAYHTGLGWTTDALARVRTAGYCAVMPLALINAPH